MSTLVDRILVRLGRVRGSLSYYLDGLYRRTGRHHVFLLASGMAFTLLICIMPLMLILFAALGAFLDQPDIKGEIDLLIERVIPYPDAAQFVKEFIAGRLTEFTAYKSIAGFIGSIGLLFAATGLFSSMRTILDVIFKPNNPESILHGKLRDLIFVALVLVYFLAIVVAGPAFDIITGLGDEFGFLKGIQLGALQEWGLNLISFLLIMLGFTVVYYAVPHQGLPKTTILISAFWAALMWHLVAQGFDYYITNFITFRRLYGPYALLITIVFWCYYTSIVFIAGAEIGQLHRERREDLPPSSLRHNGPSRFFRE